MPKFIYTAKRVSTGETLGGEVEAKDERSLAQDLRSQGLLLTSHRKSDETPTIQVRLFDRFKRVPLKEKMSFTRNLSVMVASGLTISRAVKNLSLQTQNATFKTILDDVYEDLQAGKTLSDGLSKYPNVFDELFVSMVYVGEVGGSLEQVLDILALQLEKENELSSKVRGALIYPAVILSAMAGIGVLMLTYILPKITGVFKDMNVELPQSTLFIMSMSDFLRDHWIISFVLVVGIVVGVKSFYGTVMGRHFFDGIFVRLPIIGNIVMKVNCARFARVYGSLLGSGVSVVNALSIVSRTLGNVLYRDAIMAAVGDVQKGVELSQAIGQYPLIFPVLVPQIIEVGEETGKTEIVLGHLASYYEDEVSQITKNMSSIIEPILMLVIGVGVGFFAIAMLQPIYSVMDSIQ